jgi:DNA-binding IclR family transcriptional regulator
VAVKRSLSATRMLKVFEAIAEAQPIGVSALAGMLGADKSAVQRDLMTLSDAEWIRSVAGSGGRWELTPRVLTLAHTPHSSNGLRQRARPALEQLRAETGETAYLTVPDGDHFVVIDAFESPHVLRMVPPIGLVVPIEGSATARAVLPHLPEAEQTRLLGRPLSSRLAAEFAITRERGYAVNDEDIAPGAIAMASAILGPGTGVLGALVLTGPTDRLPPARRGTLGAALHLAAKRLSLIAA